MQKLLKIVLASAAFGGWLYFYYPTLSIIYKDKVYDQKICKSKVTYSIDQIDSRFNLSKDDASRTVVEAVSVWEKAMNTDLFEEVESGGAIRVTFEFDQRQKTTNTLSGINDVIQNENSQIDLQRLNYNTLMSQYSAAKADYEYSLKRYYELRGSDQASIDKAASQLKNKQVDIERMRIALNTHADNLNEKVSEINTKINTFNNLGQERGETFHEGEYVVDRGNRAIRVYEFEDKEKLVRLLSHEFGHALGLEHVSGTKSIMNEVNGSNNTKPTKEDTAELNRVCLESK